jgi:hypothetical protein
MKCTSLPAQVFCLQLKVELHGFDLRRFLLSRIESVRLSRIFRFHESSQTQPN